MLEIQKHIQKFVPIGLSEMDNVSLLKRVDTKFVMSLDILPLVLQDLYTSYKVLQISGNRIMSYHSIYFDSPSFNFYLNHHNQRKVRTKIRIRKYVDSDLTFLEIKQKDNKGVLNKSRIRINYCEPSLTKEAISYIKKTTNKEYQLSSPLSNQFNRITLVNNNMKERVTIDMSLAYNHAVYNPNLVIVELKQEKFDRNSHVVKTLKKYSINPFSISKYCIGMALNYPNLKQNLFKQKINYINKI